MPPGGGLVTIGEKWAWLFHKNLQLGDAVGADLALEAKALIAWLYKVYKQEQEKQGFEISPQLEKETVAVLSALENRIKGLTATSWPSDILNRWSDRGREPFHASLGRALLDSDWELFFKQQAAGFAPTKSGTTVWLIAEDTELRAAWGRVTKYLREEDNKIRVIPSCGSIEADGSGLKIKILFGSVFDKQRHLAACEYLVRSSGLKALLLDCFSVSCFLKITE